MAWRWFPLPIVCAFAGCQDPVYFGSTEGGRETASNTPQVTLRLFETSLRFKGDLRTAGKASSGIDGADMLCQLSADYASLGGKWRAYISTSTVDAIDRVPDAGPWRTLKTSFSQSTVSDAKGFTQPIENMTNERAEAVNDFYWSGSAPFGKSSGINCKDWTTSAPGTDGQYGTSTAAFSANTFDTSCAFESALLCFELP